MKLFLRTHDQIEKAKRRLQLLRHLAAFNEPAFTVAMSRNPPQIGAIVDVQGGFASMFTSQPHGLQDSRFSRGMRQVRAGCDKRPCLTDECLVYILLGECHVGAVLAIENQREMLFVSNPEKNESRQPLAVRDHPTDIDSFPDEFLTDETAHMFVTDPRDDRAFQSETRRAARNVCRTAANVFPERSHVFQAPPDLRAIQINAGATDRDYVKGFFHIYSLSFQRCHHFRPEDHMKYAKLLFRDQGAIDRVGLFRVTACNPPTRRSR